MICSKCHEQKSNVVYQRAGYAIKPGRKPFLMVDRNGNERPGHSVSGIRSYNCVCFDCTHAIDNTSREPGEDDDK